MLRFLAACLLLACELSLSRASDLPPDNQIAWFPHGNGIVTCLQLAFRSVDGCTSAPAYVNSTLSFQKANLFTDTTGGFFQTGQASSGVININWNVTGKDFAVGARMIGTQPSKTINGVFVANPYCNDTTGVSVLAPKIPCSIRNGAEGLIDPTLYDYSGDPAGWGCASGSSYSAVNLQITCNIASTGTVAVHVQGVDFFAGSVCHVLYANNSSGSNNGSVEISDFYWKYSNSLGTGAVNGCASPAQSYPIRVNLGNASTISTLADYGIVDQDIPNSGIVSQDTLWLHSGGSGAVRYVAGLNLNSRVARIDSCSNQETSFLTANPAGYYPGGNHFEWALFYPTRYFDMTCTPVQKVYNNTIWTNAVTNSPGSTAPISTNQPAAITVSASSYNTSTQQITLTVTGLGSGNFPLGGTMDAGTYVMFNSMNGADGSLIAGQSYPLVAGSTSTTLILQTSLGATARTFGTGSAFGATYASLDAELNTVGTNKIGGASYYYALGETAPTVGGTTSGYVNGDIVQINDGCSTHAQVKVTNATGGVIAASGILSYTGGVCNSSPGTSGSNPGTGPFTTTPVTGSGSGLTLTNATYQFWTTGYGIQPGQATYLTSFNVTNNAIDDTGTAAAGSNAIYYQRTNCPGTSVATNNFKLTNGATITASRIQNTTCAAS